MTASLENVLEANSAVVADPGLDGLPPRLPEDVAAEGATLSAILPLSHGGVQLTGDQNTGHKHTSNGFNLINSLKEHSYDFNRNTLTLRAHDMVLFILHIYYYITIALKLGMLHSMKDWISRDSH